MRGGALPTGVCRHEKGKMTESARVLWDLAEQSKRLQQVEMLSPIALSKKL